MERDMPMEDIKIEIKAKTEVMKEKDKRSSPTLKWTNSLKKLNKRQKKSSEKKSKIKSNKSMKKLKEKKKKQKQKLNKQKE